MKFTNTSIWGFEHAIRGMRNPMESWSRSDSREVNIDSCLMGKDGEYRDSPISFYRLGENDLNLAQRLIKAGSEHRKFLRQIFVSVDITAPLFWWKEADMYKVGTVSNSTSTMHKLASTPITLECFETGDFDETAVNFSVEQLLRSLDELRLKYLSTKDKRYWKELIRWLPESWLQTRTVTMNYENILNMYQQRCVHLHKLTEWSVRFKAWVESLPYAKELFVDPFSTGEIIYEHEYHSQD